MDPCGGTGAAPPAGRAPSGRCSCGSTLIACRGCRSPGTLIPAWPSQPLGGARPARRRAQQSGRAIGDGLRGAGDRAVVTAGDRAGQRRRAGRPQFSSAARASGSSTSRSSPAVEAARPQPPPPSSGSSPRWTRPRDRRRGRPRRPAPAATRARPPAPRRRTARGVDRTRRRDAVEVGAVSVTVISGCTLKASRAPRTSRPEAPEQCPTSGPDRSRPRPSAMASSGTHSSTSGVAGAGVTAAVRAGTAPRPPAVPPQRRYRAGPRRPRPTASGRAADRADSAGCGSALTRRRLTRRVLLPGRRLLVR